MANKRGQLNCDKSSRNTGFGSCFEDWKLIVGALIFDSPRSFTDAEIEELQTTLEDAAKADSKSARMYPVHNFVAATDNTEDLTVQTFDYGPKHPVKEGDNDWMFQFTDGGNCLAQSLRTHNGKAYVLFYDKDMKILGYRSNNKLAAIPQQFVHTLPWKLATGSTTAQYMIRFVFNSKYANDFREFVKADFDLGEIVGLKDIEMVINSFDQTTGLANISFQTACGAVNLYDLFSAQLANAAIFDFVDQDGNVVTQTSRIVHPATKSIDITLDPTTFPDGGRVYIRGKAVSVLATAGIDGYEIIENYLEIEGS